MKFEKFVAKFIQELDELEKRNRGLHNADVVDIIWKKMMNPELSQYATSLKLQFKRQPRYYQYILQDIAIQVPSFHIPNFRKASKVGTQDHIHTNGFLNKGAYDNHGKLYIGTYPFHK